MASTDGERPVKPASKRSARLACAALLLAWATAHGAPAERVALDLPAGTPVDPAQAATLGLDPILIYADAHAPAIRVARSRVRRAEAELVGADIALPANPEVSFGAGARSGDGGRGFEFEVGVQQALEIAGEVGLRRAAARDRRLLAEAAVDEVRWQVHVEAHRLFVDLLLVRERRAQAERFVAFSQSLRDIAARQVEAGESSPVILLVADADLAQTREALVEAEQLQVALRTRLAAVIGWPDAPLPPIEGALPPIRPAPPVESLVQRMAARHPALRARAIAARAGRSRLALEDREVWPEPTVGLSYAREAGLGGEPGADVFMAHLGFSLPLWRRNQGERARAEAEVVVAERAAEATAAELRGALVEAAAALDAAAARVALYRTGVVPQLEQNLTLLQRAYELGEVDVHQVSQTRERLLAATGRAIEARVAWYETAAALEGLVGSEIWAEGDDR